MQPERRKTARYITKLDIDIILQDGTILPVQTQDLSQSGLQFKCDGSVANEIDTRGIQNHLLDHLKVKIIARLPTDEKQKFYASGRIITARRLSQEEYMLGLEFTDFEKNSAEILKNYIQQLALDALG